MIQFSRSVWEKARLYDAVYDSAAQLTAEVSQLTALVEKNAQLIRVLDEQVNQQKECSEEDEMRIEELSRNLIISQSFHQLLWIFSIDRVIRSGDLITFVFAPSSRLIGGEKILLIDRQTGSVLAYLEIIGLDDQGGMVARTVRVLDSLYWTEIRKRAALSSELGADIIAVVPPEE